MAMLRITSTVHTQMVAHALRAYPLEACGLFAGDPSTNIVTAFVPCANTAASSKYYTIDGREHLRAEREAEDEGLEILGVMHSHTHTEAYPSPTDVNQAPDPTWQYIIVSLKRDAPILRSYTLANSIITEEPVIVTAD
jgi:[CysO sulfur-carrier protein]-S-L-cysteine hydrolase